MSENDNRGIAGGDRAILSIAEIKDRAAGSIPVDRGALVTSGGAAVKADEVAQAGKQIGLAYIDAHERAAIITIELRERFAAATNTAWVKSMARTRAALERDAANACFSLARGLLA
jgi:hypothetical protein